jgi:hypothetical protein
VHISFLKVYRENHVDHGAILFSHGPLCKSRENMGRYEMSNNSEILPDLLVYETGVNGLDAQTCGMLVRQDLKAGGICSISPPATGCIKKPSPARARGFTESHFLVSTTENRVVKIPTAAFEQENEEDRRGPSFFASLCSKPASLCTATCPVLSDAPV